jgi:predicted Ser/Thr protein kinase
VDQGRFLPGTVLARRYRITGLLGRGGMGEVYRADDLKLGQPVALKFLAREVERDEGRLQRFLNEVRMALKVTHPNVTRVYDIGEVDGHHYISMEYVDGEDLSSLLRRIGRLPKTKAVQVARQLCAGLAAAHDQGVLHRDLKPANVMLDGRGQVKITDFGLAGLERTIAGVEARAGTPAYMAPEQWAGDEVTARTDVYALGLVLYELFTGQSVFAGKTPAEILKLQQEGSSTVTSPSTVIEGFDPAVERVILKCMEKEPAARPGSALAVSVALPGGDPLAAALAAGETPSPELVAQAGNVGGLQPLVAGMCVVIVLLGVMAAFWLAGRQQLVRLAPLERPPAYLATRAQEILADLGYEASPADRLYVFEPNELYLAHLRDQGIAGQNHERLRSRQPAVLTFRYRQSQHLLSRINAASIGNWMIDPPGDRPGMIQLDLDPLGRLLQLTAVPWEAVEISSSPAETEWNQLFEMAGLDRAGFDEVPPDWVPPVFADVRQAWQGTYPESQEVPIRVEAAALGARPVWFRIVDPWIEPSSAEASESPALELVPVGFGIWLMAVLAVAGVLAWRNLRMGRGDRRGALRLAVFFGAVRMLWLLAAHHLPSGAEIDLFIQHLAWAGYRICLVWIFYIALEPYARRMWPHILTAWVRLLDGRFKDPLVGRDVLMGVVMGSVLTLVGAAAEGATMVLDREPLPTTFTVWSQAALRGGRCVLGAVSGNLAEAIWNLFMAVMMFLLLRLLLRRTWAAVVVTTILGAALVAPESGDPWVYVVFILCFLMVFWLALLRFGLVTVLIGFTVSNLLATMPMTLNLSAWYASSTWVTLMVVAALTMWGFYVSLAGRPVFKDALLGEPSPSGTIDR